MFKNPQKIEETLHSLEEKELVRRLAQKVIDETPSVDDWRGFSRVIQHISELKKPIVLHNGVFDVMHMYDKFLRSLPPTFSEFRESFRESFPYVFDTKYAVTNSVALSLKVGAISSLGIMYDRMMKEDMRMG